MEDGWRARGESKRDEGGGGDRAEGKLGEEQAVS